MATMKEVADYAEVSVATVSRVINGTGYVSPDLKDRVYRAMRELNYQPSALARSLRRRESLTVGILIPQLDHPFFGGLAFAIEKTLFASDYRTLICSAEENPEKESSYIDMLIQQRVDGVIFAPTGQSVEPLHRLRDSSIPVVLVDRDLKRTQVDKVLSDNFQGGYEGAQYLLEIGHRNIGIIGALMYSEAMLLRLAGVKQALADYNVSSLPEAFVIGASQAFEMGYTIATQMLQQPNRPTAIFALTDVIAIGVLHAAAELGLRLPGDLSVLGYDNVPLAAYSIPSLTTVGQPIYEMGETAAAILLKRIHEPDAPYETITLENKLVIRKSTLPLA